MALVNQNKLGVEEDGTKVADLKQYKKIFKKRKKPKTNQSDKVESDSECDSDLE